MMDGCVKALYFAFICTLLGGCTNNNSCDKKTIPLSKGEYIKSGCPMLPPSAERRLLDGLDARSISDIGSLVYVSGYYSYVGVQGEFSVNWGTSLHSSYVLRKDRNHSSWENAKVYKWERETIRYKNHFGEEITRNVSSLGTLMSLPEGILTNILYEVNTLAEWAGAEIPKKGSPIIGSGQTQNSLP